MLPEGWKEVKLGEAVSFLDGKRKPLKSEDRLKIRGQYPYYGATGIIDYVNDYIFDDTLILMGEDGENIISRNLPHVFIICGKTWVNNHAHVLKAKKHCDAHFISSYLESLDYKKYNTGSAQPKLNKSICESIRVFLPPFPEQKKIAAILSTWDRAIEVTEKLLANSLQQRKALMQQLLTGKKRLPGFTGEWKSAVLGAIANIETGSSNREDSSVDGLYAFFDRSEDIRTSSRYLFDCEAIIVPGEGQDFIPKYFQGKFDLHQRTYAIHGFDGNDGKFLYFTLSFHKSYLLSQAVGSTVKSLRLPMFKKMPVRLPALPEQKAIATVLTKADEEIALLKADLTRLRQEKKALMQQLLTGKRRVKIEADAG